MSNHSLPAQNKGIHMKLTRQPNLFEIRYPNLAPLLYRLRRMGRQGRNGLYYVPQEPKRRDLPDYIAVRDALPEPVLEGNPEWVSLFNWIWESAYTRHLAAPAAETGFVADYIDAGLDKNLYLWDMTFIILYARYGHRFFPAIQALDNFYVKQREDGLIWRIFDETSGREHWWGNYPSMVNPPLFAWTELENLKLTGDDSRIRRILPALEAYTGWINRGMKCRRSVHHLYWNSPDGSGMDNTPRGGSGWIDMSCQVVLNHRCMAELYRRTGEQDRAHRHEQQANEISRRINQWMWDEQDQFYYDVDNRGNKIRVKTIASCWSMLSGVASSQQTEGIVRHLRDEEEFWTEVPFPSLARSEKLYDPTARYWQGGVWAPTNYMTIRGLSVRGYDELASEAAERYLKALSEVFDSTGTVWELYAPERNPEGRLKPGTNKDGRTLCGKDFTGWTGVGPVALLIEQILGFSVEGIKSHITWKIRRIDSHGIRRLSVGNALVTLICRKRNTPEDRVVIDAECDRGVTLTLIRPEDGTEKTVALASGSSVIKF